MGATVADEDSGRAVEFSVAERASDLGGRCSDQMRDVLSCNRFAVLASRAEPDQQSGGIVASHRGRHPGESGIGSLTALEEHRCLSRMWPHPIPI